jgi:hypothetical protein
MGIFAGNFTAQQLANGQVKANSPKSPILASPVQPQPAAQTQKPQPQQNQARPGETAPQTTNAQARGSGSASETDPATAAYYADMANRLRNFLGSVDSTRQQGLDRINDEYNTNVSKVNSGYNITKRDLGIKSEEATADKNKSLRGISDNIANSADSFRRLLALGHSGNSAFAHDFVPKALSREGTQQRGATLDTYGRNARKLDLAGKDADQQYQSSIDDLGRQKRESQFNFESGVEQNKQDLLDRLSEALYREQVARGGNDASVRTALAPYTDQANSSIARLQALFSQYRNPSYNVTPVNVSIPDLETYTADPLVASLASDSPGANPADGVYLPSLRRRFQEQIA